VGAVNFATGTRVIKKSDKFQPCCLQLGGNSLQAGAVASRLRKSLALQQDVPAAWVYTYQTIRLLANQIARHAHSSAVQRLPLLPSISKEAATGSNMHARLSFQQEQFLLLWQQDPESAVYNFPWGVRLRGKLDVAALQTAFRLLGQRHLVLLHLLQLSKKRSSAV
jgi:hypothetical protein